MAIGVAGQFLFIFSISGAPDRFKDFIKEEELEEFTLIEEAGNLLPSFQLTFTTNLEDIVNYLNEGNVLEVTFGQDSKDMLTTKLYVSNLKSARAGQDKYKIEIVGLYSEKRYLAEPLMKIYGNKSGVEVIKEVTKDHFEPDFNIDKSNDSMNWIQHNVSDKRFVRDVWLHSYIPNSFIMTGITSDGKYRVRDVLKDVTAKRDGNYDYRFTPEIKDTKDKRDLIYDGDYLIDANTGFNNMWMGYGKEKKVQGFESGTDSSLLEEIKPLLAQSSKLMRDSLVAKRVGTTVPLTDNVHENYWKAYLKNLQYLVTFSNTEIAVSVPKIFFPIRILDLVMFVDREIKGGGFSGFYSGLYFVTKVSRTVQNRQFVTTILLSREGFNEAKGNLR